MAFDLKDYVTVPERVAEFYRQHPDGRIVSDPPTVIDLGSQTFIGVTTSVYRSPEDVLPCVATAWEPFPGRTQFTKESEMMNAETSAIGRALAAAGIMVSRSLASANEVAARQPETGPKTSGQAPRGRSNDLAPEAVVNDIVSRLGALRGDVRKMAKQAFVEQFGPPGELKATGVATALDLVAEWERA